ncbi:MAG: hypothetical protein RLZZ60_1356 [Bacteroidota bacterium]
MLKSFAKLTSVLCHPLLLMNFGLFSIMFWHPYFVSKFYETQFYTISMFVSINTLILPMLSVYLLKRFGLIDDFAMSNPKQRLLPYSIMIGIIGLTMFQLYKIDYAGLPMWFMGACAISLMANVLINLKFTISTHGIGTGGLVALYAYISYTEHLLLFKLLLIGFVLVSGIVMWARLYLQAHTEKEVYTGFLLGFATTSLVLLGL